MPYVDAETRHCLVFGRQPKNAGELNYCVTLLLETYRRRHGTNYAVINEMIGALECAKLELYRRIAAPYEDTKCAKNGDVYST